ncbi:Uncharacterized conserved protein, DUF2267 family [Micromonospora rhizosphaerae]|uniref:Uncharacterized conserved protein, DUF2267 family n=1 Tax=Micromonospora rhizosphaerae TaxID=568872 RepID=A0A1C6R9K9_9ACTN|nr:DUF2267 domain-containing protein [Micromonospora rhizosphaerae]SCL13800.1 Uncharacterized conserved protein, DUF2267 family [Micromonospora rhizosphaerae]
MNYADFIEVVARRAGVPSEKAEAVSRATLETLTDRITAGQASHIAGQLPVELRQNLHKTTTAMGAQIAESFELDEFVERVAARAGVDVAMADAGMRAVLSTIGEVVSKDELQDLVSQLPKEFWEIIQAGARVEVRPRSA